MNKKLAAALVLMLVVLSAAAPIAEEFGTKTSSFGMEIGKNWQLLSVMAIMISVVLVAIAYAIGVGLEMPEIKAWAGTELVQIIVNAIIVALLIVTIAFIEMLVLAIASTSLDAETVPECFGQSGETTGCLQSVTDAYMKSYLETAKNDAKNAVRQNMDLSAQAGRRYGLYCLTIYCIQLGATFGVNGNYVLKSDMYMSIFEHYTSLISSMEAQRFFVTEICFKMGPVVLAIGVVARSFFLTRKLGGLLIAIAAGIMFFFPGMYIFDWLTLDMMMNGDKAMEDEASLCPPECGKAAPMALTEDGGNLYSANEIYAAFSESKQNLAAKIIAGTSKDEVGTDDYGVVTSCNYEADESECPYPCRELPYPSVPTCLNMTAEIPQNCAKVPKSCKVIRYVETIDETQNERCPDECKVVPPLKSNCNVDEDGDDDEHCVRSSPDCRVAKRDDMDWRPTKDCDNDMDGCDEAEKRCRWAKDCPADTDATDSCTYVIPTTGPCDEICSDCPAECRLGGSGADPPDDCPGSCDDCTAGCEARWSDLEALDELADGNNTCTSCPLNKRLVYQVLPTEYYTGSCSYTKCPKDYRVTIPYQACEMCLFTEASYMYDPPINLGCDTACKPSDTKAVSDPSAYMQVGETGLVGLQPIQNVAKLYLPAYLLPLFNIVMTLVMIKGLSDILGGDIEIPGLAKVF